MQERNLFKFGLVWFGLVWFGLVRAATAAASALGLAERQRSRQMQPLFSPFRCPALSCRQLKILLLQNNIIAKMENLHHMKSLEYLNLALNNIRKIEGVERCEFLNKLDLTINFIDLDDLEESIDNLVDRVHLKDLYMMGNPAEQDWKGFKSYVIARLPQLQQLDGTELTRSMKIVSRDPRRRKGKERKGKESKNLSPLSSSFFSPFRLPSDRAAAAPRACARAQGSRGHQKEAKGCRRARKGRRKEEEGGKEEEEGGEAKGSGKRVRSFGRGGRREQRGGGGRRR